MNLKTFWARLGDAFARVARRVVEQYHREPALRVSQQQPAIQSEQQHWVPVCEGVSAKAPGALLRAERPGLRAWAVTHLKARQPGPVFRFAGTRTEGAAPDPVMGQPLKSLAPLIFCMAMLLLSGGVARAEYSKQDSDFFVLDTQTTTSQAEKFGSLFLLDTRFGASSSQNNGGLFRVDTRETLAGSVILSGTVRAAGLPLAGAVIRIEINGQAFETLIADEQGVFSLPNLPPGEFRVRASKGGWNSVRSELKRIEAGEQVAYSFNLVPMLAPPVAQRVEERIPTEEEKPKVVLNDSPQLWLFKDGNWAPGQDPIPGRMTVVITHGWKSGADAGWVKTMAAALIEKSSRPLNVFAWNWREEAKGIELKIDEAQRQGPKLGKALAKVFPTGHQQPAHFIGHSLGTIVNRYATDYLHGDAKEEPGWTWEPTLTHLTLCDQAEIGSLVGETVLQNAANAFVFTANFASAILVAGVTATEGWKSPLPERFIAADNLISLVGLPKTRAVNVFLNQSAARANGSVTAAHGYAYDWYIQNIQYTGGSAFGFRYSFENSIRDTFAPSPFRNGSLLTQDFYPADPQRLTPVNNLQEAALALIKAAQQPGRLVADAWIKGVEFSGNAVVNVVESFKAGAGALAEKVNQFTPAFLLPSGVRASDLATSSIWTPQFILRSAPQLAPSGVRANNLPREKPGSAWVRIQVPAESAYLSFDFVFTGDVGEDALACAVNGTNVVSFNGNLFPNDVTHGSGLIDISKYSGQEVELFFGLVGGTAVDGAVSVRELRFHDPLPELEIIPQNNGTVKLAWFAGSGGSKLERSQTLKPGSWEAINASITMTNLQKEAVFPSVTGEEFFRLAR